MTWLLKNLVALAVGVMLSCAGMAIGASMEVEGLWGLLLGFFVGDAGFLVGLAAILLICQRSKFAAVVSAVAQISGTIFMLSEWEVSFDSFGGVILSSLFVSVVIVILLFSMLSESEESKEKSVPAPQKPIQVSSNSAPVTRQTSVPDGFLMVVWSVKMKTWDTVAIQGKIMEGRISTGKKVYFYRSNQMIVADNIADMEVGGRARSYASKGEVVELILNWNNDAYFKNCTSVRDSPAR